MTRRAIRLCGVALVGAIVALAAAPDAVADDNPVARVSGVHIHPGKVDLTFTVTGLPVDETLDAGSIDVSAGAVKLDSHAKAIERVGSSAAPSAVREVILTVDTSGSMDGAGIAAARSAATTYAAQLSKDVRVGLVTFADKSTTLLRPTTDRAALTTAIAKLRANGGTALYDGVAASLSLMRNLPNNAQRRLLVLSDGDDTSSSRSLPSLLSSLRSTKVAADVVAFRLPGSRTVLNQIAAASHGRVLPADDAGGLAAAFAKAAQAFGQRFSVEVTVPREFNKRAVDLVVSIAVGTQTVSAHTTQTLSSPPPGFGTNGGSAAAGTLHDAHLWLVLGLVFASILAIGLALLFTPVLRNERAAWQSRVAEAGRYRVVRVLGDKGEADLTSESGESAVTRRALSVVDRAVRARGQRERLMNELERAGMRMRPEEWAVIQLAAVVGSVAVVTVLTKSIIGVVIGAFVGWVLCRLFIRIKIDRRLRSFEDQLPDNLQLLAGSLRSGFTLAQALGTVVREGTEPSASEFTRALTEVRLGADLEDALDRVADRMKCRDLRWVVMAIRISREVGGNLAEVLENTVETMRERARIRGVIRILSADARMSARILTALPITVGSIFILVRPKYVRPLFHSLPGGLMLTAAVIELVLGAVWLNRLTKIEV